MKYIFKKFFSKDRIKLIKEHFTSENSQILEIGTHRGNFSKQILENLNPKKLILADPWIAYEDKIYKNSWYGRSNHSNQEIQNKYYIEVNQLFEKEIKENKVEIFRKTSDEFFNKNSNKFDLIYIDGNHLFEFVKRDIDNSLKFLKDNGVIILDDYKLKGWWNDGVTKAIKFHEKEKNIKIITGHNLLNYHHQCIIKKFK